MPTMRSLLLALCVGALCASASPALRGDEIASLVPVLAELQTEGGTPPICLFVHGLGQNPSPKPNSVLDDFPAYWGKTKAAVSQFCTAKFLYYNAVDYGWNDNSLQKYVCGQIRDTGARIVFTHSMGNNVVGGGIMSKVAGCDKFVKYSADGSTAVAGSKFWVSLQGVFNGSPAADFCSSICSASLADAIRHPGLKKLAIAFTSKVGPLRDKCGCPGKKKLPSPAINSCSKPTAGIPAGNWTKLQETARDFSWRALCGLGPFPVSLKPVDSLLMPIPYVLLEALSGYGNDFKTNENMPYSGTDGFVNFHSCNANRPDNVWAKIPTARLYVGRMNHGDGTGRAGDGINQDQKPLVFMTESVKALLPRIK